MALQNNHHSMVELLRANALDDMTEIFQLATPQDLTLDNTPPPDDTRAMGAAMAAAQQQQGLGQGVAAVAGLEVVAGLELGGAMDAGQPQAGPAVFAQAGKGGALVFPTPHADLKAYSCTSVSTPSAVSASSASYVPRIPHRGSVSPPAYDTSATV